MGGGVMFKFILVFVFCFSCYSACFADLINFPSVRVGESFSDKSSANSSIALCSYFSSIRRNDFDLSFSVAPGTTVNTYSFAFLTQKRTDSGVGLYGGNAGLGLYMNSSGQRFLHIPVVVDPSFSVKYGASIVRVSSYPDGSYQVSVRVPVASDYRLVRNGRDVTVFADGDALFSCDGEPLDVSLLSVFYSSVPPGGGAALLGFDCTSPSSGDYYHYSTMPLDRWFVYAFKVYLGKFGLWLAVIVGMFFAFFIVSRFVPKNLRFRSSGFGRFSGSGSAGTGSVGGSESVSAAKSEMIAEASQPIESQSGISSGLSCPSCGAELLLFFEDESSGGGILRKCDSCGYSDNGLPAVRSFHRRGRVRI